MPGILRGTRAIAVPRAATSLAYWPAWLVAAAGAAMLIYWLQTARPMWVDEEMLALNARDRTFGQLGGALWLDQSAPLGWLALERLALQTLGTSEPAARTVNTLFGIAMLITAAWIGRRLMTPAGALVLALLCAFGEWLIFFVLELKHYSADAFGSLLLVGLGAWALDAGIGSDRSRRRVLAWWSVAAAALWFSNGALFVTPGIAFVIMLTVWQRRDWTALRRACTGATLWLSSFAVDYVAVLRHALHNSFLKNYWGFAFPPADAGVVGIAGWAAGLARPFAIKPGGAALWAVFCSAAVAGIVYAIARRRPIGWIVLTVPASAIALAVLHFVPPFERLVVWAVPPIYVAVALGADAVMDAIGRERRSPMTWAIALGLFVLAALACADVVERGYHALRARPRSNYGLDDRRSVRWLLGALRPGDMVLTTHFGLGAIWWYGDVDISDASRVNQLANGVPLFEVGYQPPGPACTRGPHELRAALQGHSRVVVYLGFRLNVLPPGFDYLVLEELGKRGALVGYQRYAEESRVAIFDLTDVPTHRLVIPGESTESNTDLPRAAAGCLTVTPASR